MIRITYIICGIFALLLLGRTIYEIYYIYSNSYKIQYLSLYISDIFLICIIFTVFPIIAVITKIFGTNLNYCIYFYHISLICTLLYHLICFYFYHHNIRIQLNSDIDFFAVQIIVYFITAYIKRTGNLTIFKLPEIEVPKSEIQETTHLII